MAKKFYDILPPGTEKEKPFRPEKKVVRCRKTKPFLIGFFLVVFVGQFFFTKLEIIIEPETERVEYSGQVNDITVEVFEIKEELTKVFSSSGKEKEEKKAQGVLKVYNNHSSSSQILVANTRFMSADGKLFYSQERISIPGRRQEGNRTVPGEAEVRVVAAEAGQQYNIERKSKFSVPGLQGTPMYTSVYAENLEPITGGYIGEMPKILARDISSAKEVLIEDILDKAQEKIKSEVSDDFVLDKELMRYQVAQESVYPGLNENFESFEISIMLEIKVFSYRKTELKEKAIEFLSDEIKDELSENDFFSFKKINPETLEISTIVDSVGDTLKLTVKFSADSYYNVDQDYLYSFIKNKKIKEVKETLEEQDEVKQVRIKKWPFWLGKVPNLKRVSID